MRRLLLTSAALAALCGPARADLVSNPVLFPSAALIPGACIQATGPNTIASTGGPCGSGSGSGNVSGPTSSTVGDIAVFSNGTGSGLADSNVMAASIPFLGANQTWGGTNAYEIRPTFNGAVPWDSANFTPTLYGQLAGRNVWTNDNTWTGLTTFSSRPLFGLATPWDSANLDPTIFATSAQLTAALVPYLKSADAAATYLTQTSAASLYLTKTAATSTYMPFTGGTFTGPVTFNQAPTYTGAATDFRGTHITTNNVLRWNIGADGAESGSSTGSDLHIYGYNDAGVFQGAAVTFTRPNLTATFLHRPVFGTATPWDSLNFDPTQYLTIASAAATYTTPAEVDAALSTFLTKTDAAATYLPKTGGTLTGNLVVSTAGGAFPSLSQIELLTSLNQQIYFRADDNFGGASFGIYNGNVSNYLFVVQNAANVANFTERPTFKGGAIPWDSTNLPSPLSTTAAASTYLTIANAATTYLPIATANSTYLKLAGGTVTGGVQFNAIPTLNVTLPPVTDSSGDVASSAWVQAVITSRVGTGPFLPVTGVGAPYDIAIPYQGTLTPTKPVAGTHILHYVFTRKVVIPVGFAGSVVECITPSTATVQLGIFSTGVAGGIGNVVFAPGATRATFSTTGGPFIFNPGDVLAISTSGSTPDTTLAGFFGTLEGTISP